MMGFRALILMTIMAVSGPAFSQSAAFEINGYGHGHWLDTIKTAVHEGFVNARSAQEQTEVRQDIVALVDSLMGSPVDKGIKSYSNRIVYKIWDKRADFSPYISTLKNIGRFAPKDSIGLRFFSNYQIGNTYIFREEYDTAAAYLIKAYHLDKAHDIADFEGSVEERAALILYKFGHYDRSLKFAEFSLTKAKGRLRAAVFNQLGNIYNLLERYQEAALAYDSAAFMYDKLGINNWMPLFNSMTAYLEIEGGEEKFLLAYERIKNETALLQYDQYKHIIEVAKAEFSLTYWKRPERYNAELFGEMILQRTPENAREVRRILENHIDFTESSYLLQVEAYEMLERYYKLVHPDSVSFALREMLSINRSYNADLRAPKTKTGNLQVFNEESPLQKLILAIGLDQLEATEKNRQATLYEIRTGTVWLIVYIVLLAASIFGLFKTWKLRKRRKRAIEELRALHQKKQQLIEDILPPQYHDSIHEDLVSKSKSERHSDTIVLIAGIQGFSTFAQKAPLEELIDYLNEFFDRFDADCRRFGLEKLKTDGDSFIAIGGFNEDFASPQKALKAARAMQKTITSINLELRRLNAPLSLRIGIDIGTVDAGLLAKSLIFDMWGEVFRRAKKLESACQPGQILVSETCVSAEPTGVKWPNNQLTMVDDIPARIFKT